MKPATEVLQHAGRPAEWIVLENGFVVIAYRDAKGPGLSVRVTYQVGSSAEPKSKNGLAHLFEHLMFAGTRSFPGNAFLHLEGCGATSINAVVREDYTTYLATVPSASLDKLLAFEAERAEFLPSAFDSRELERSRRIVRNELVQRMSQPYGMVDEILARESYRPEHPYCNPANGTTEQLDDLTLKDTADWFSAHSNPAHATLVVAGDIQPREVFDKAQLYFGNLRTRPAPAPVNVAFENAAIHRRIAIQHDYPESRIYHVWNLPCFASHDRASFALLIELIVGTVLRDENKRTVRSIGGSLQVRLLGSQLIFWTSLGGGSPLATVEERLREQIGKIAQGNFSQEDLEKARRSHLLMTLVELNGSTGPGSRAEQLASGWIFARNPNTYLDYLRDVAFIPPARVQQIFRLLDDPTLVLEVEGHSIKPLRLRFHSELSRTFAADACSSGRLVKTDPVPPAPPSIMAVCCGVTPLFEF